MKHFTNRLFQPKIWSRPFVCLLFILFWVSLTTSRLYGQNTTEPDTILGNKQLDDAKALIGRQQYQQAMIKIDSAKTIFQNVNEGNCKGFAASLLYEGICLMDLGKNEQAIRNFNQSLTLAKSLFGNKHTLVASVNNSLGAVYANMGDLEKALEYKMNALEVFKRLLGERDPTIARVYNGIGLTYLNKFDLDKAFEYFQKCLNIHLEKLGENHPDVARTYMNIGVVYLEKGDYDRAIDYTRKALAIFLQTGNRNSTDVGKTLSNLGNLSRRNSKYESALRYHQEAQEVFKAVLPPEHPEHGKILFNLGYDFFDSTDYRQSLRFFKASYTHRLQYLDAGDPRVAASLNMVGNVFLEMNELDSALFYQFQARDMLLENNDTLNPDYGYVLYNISDTYRSLGDYKKSLQYATKGLESTGFTGNNYNDLTEYEAFLQLEAIKAWGLNERWAAHHNNQDLDQALACVEQADSLIELLRTFYADQIATTEVARHASKVYNIAVTICLNLAHQQPSSAYFSRAFGYAEKAKAMLLFESVLESKAQQYANIPPERLAVEYQSKVDMAYLEDRIRGLEEDGTDPQDSLLQVLNSRYFTVRQQLHDLHLAFERSYPNYYQLKYKFSTLPIPAVQYRLLGETSSLLEYFVGDSSIFLFVINKQDQQVKEVKMDFPLETWVRQLQSGLSAYYSLPPNDPRRTNVFRDSCERQYIAAAQNLYDKLIKPVKNQLREELIIVPDGVLGYVPFEVLLSGPAPQNTKRYQQYPYLLKEHRIRYSYSATLLQEMTDKQHRRTPEKLFGAFAPYYDGDTSVMAGLDALFTSKTIQPGDLQPLKYSGAEVAAAQKLLGGDVFSDTSATEKRFNEVAGNYRILHLSTHGKADDRVGDYSYLVFSPQKDAVENELLYCRDIYNLSLNADLVVLSACETGIGKLRRGEGIISLARAFAYAGAKSIVNSLWSVNDASTQELMVGFYKGLKKGNTKSQALAQAKRRFLEEPSAAEKSRYEQLKLRWEDFRHPYFWGGFILIGDDGGVK